MITPTVMSQVGRESLQPSIALGHFGEGLYRTVVALASPVQEVRVGSILNPHYSKGLGFWIALVTSIAALSFFWWITRPDLRRYGCRRSGRVIHQKNERAAMLVKRAIQKPRPLE